MAEARIFQISLHLLHSFSIDDACATVRATSAASSLRIYNVNIVVRFIVLSMCESYMD